MTMTTKTKMPVVPDVSPKILPSHLPTASRFLRFHLSLLLPFSLSLPNSQPSPANTANSGVYINICNTEFAKHIFPVLIRPRGCIFPIPIVVDPFKEAEGSVTRELNRLNSSFRFLSDTLSSPITIADVEVEGDEEPGTDVPTSDEVRGRCRPAIPVKGEGDDEEVEDAEVEDERWEKGWEEVEEGDEDRRRDAQDFFPTGGVDIDGADVDVEDWDRVVEVVEEGAGDEDRAGVDDFVTVCKGGGDIDVLVSIISLVSVSSLLSLYSLYSLRPQIAQTPHHPHAKDEKTQKPDSESRPSRLHLSQLKQNPRKR
ncbi:hypothetical protein C8R42DRAFT_442851 [Lentinula raphanica]|nr:hypothetical protein C8R42DRAFT_442851 [Lentinula raphanica]